ADLLAPLQAVPVAEVDDVLLAVVDDLGAHVGELAVHALAEGEDPAPDPVAGLQHHDLVAGPLDLGGGDQAGEPGPDDEQLHWPPTARDRRRGRPRSRSRP